MKKEIRVSKFLLFFALIAGIWVVYISRSIFDLEPIWKVITVAGIAILFYASSQWLISSFRWVLKRFDRTMDSISVEVLLGGTTGLLTGVLVGMLSSFPLSNLRGLGAYLTIIIFFACGYLGLRIGARRAADIWKTIPSSRRAITKASMSGSLKKVLDTSAIIDGRIYDVCLSNFIDGVFIVPTFIIEELQHIADSSDSIRRNKGRRGLELLSKMQKHSGIKIDIIEADIEEERDVDSKLIRLCKVLGASIITNDYNLNKVAELQGIRVLNINELTNAVKVMVYPGENMHINVIKEGKEEGQGVGYLEDGTMVVVEDAHDEIGNELEVVVTSVFQTAAGRMIFTRKIKDEEIAKGGNITASLQEVAEVKVYG